MLIRANEQPGRLICPEKFLCYLAVLIYSGARTAPKIVFIYLLKAHFAFQIISVSIIEILASLYTKHSVHNPASTNPAPGEEIPSQTRISKRTQNVRAKLHAVLL
jgi:hypothetical protein